MVGRYPCNDYTNLAARGRPDHAIAADRVVTTQETVRDIALACGIAPGDEMVLAIDAVENAFERLTRPPGIPGDRRFAATLVILREVMHHLRIDRVVVTAAPRST